MTTIPRSALRSFRAVVRKGLAPRGREPDPPVALVPGADNLTLLVRLPSLTIAYRVPGGFGVAPALALPLADLEAATGAGPDALSIEVTGEGQARLHWNENGQPRSRPVGTDGPAESCECPALPKAFAAMPADLLPALHEAGRTAGDGQGRFALDHVQLRGRAGEVAASDGRTAFLQGGFRFPFKESLLLPATLVFGAAELRDGGEVRLGRDDARVVLRTGPWTVWWPIRRDATYPDVAGVVPKSFAATLELDEADAAELLARLPRLPGGRDDRRPVTLDLAAGHAAVRAGSPAEGTAEVRLDRSTCTGDPVRVAVDRAYLARALKLGCRTLRAVDGDRPVVAVAGTRTLLGGALDPSCIVEPSEREALPQERGLAVIASAPAEAEPVRALVPVSPAPVPVEPPAAVDPLAEAESLGSVLVEAGQRLGRLVHWFHARRREGGTVAKIWSRLHSLSRPQGGAP